jgi:hypothetical protein
MGRVWILDTETKGTGAEMVPLDRAKQPSAGARPVVVRPKPERAPEPPRRPDPRRFRLLDALSGEVRAEDAGAEELVALLDEVRSVVDVGIQVWEPGAERWRTLAGREKRLLWDAAPSRRSSAPPAS